MIEVFTLQGESKVPLDCYVLAKVVITGFYNSGEGAVIDIEYNYDDNGVVRVSAFQDGEPLQVDSEPVPEDISWMSERPKDRAIGAPVAKNVVLCIDLSRSMRNSLEEVKNVIRDFVIGVGDENTKFGLIGFGDKVGIMRDMTNDPNTIVTALEGLKVNVYGRGTDASPLGTASTMMANRPGGKMIVILTDGIWGKGDFAVSEAVTCRNSKIAVVGVGIGEADVSFLKQISTVDEGAMYTTLDRLGETFSTIATAINSGSMGMRESSGNSTGNGRIGSSGNRGNLR
jgi:molecular chaperone DnaK